MSSTGESNLRVGPSGSPLVGRGDADRTSAITRSLLGYGLLAGPFYLVVGLAQALTRDGFEVAHDDVSLLANGSHGWIQVVNFVVSGFMTLAAAVGMARSFSVLGGGRGTVWGPRLLGVYGVALVAAGVLVADPMNGFPPGTPDGRPRSVTGTGVGHIVAGGIGFVCLVLATFLVAQHYARAQRSGVAWFSRVVGVVFLLAFVGVATGSSAAGVVLGFWLAVTLSWLWLAVVSLDLYRRTPLLTPSR